MALLSDISGIGPVLERALRDRGIRSVADLCAAAPGDLQAVPGLGPARARRLIEAACALSSDDPDIQAPDRPALRRRRRRKPSAPVVVPAERAATPRVVPAITSRAATAAPREDEGMSQPTAVPIRPRRIPPVFFTHPGPMTWVTDLGEDLVTGGTRPDLSPHALPFVPVGDVPAAEVPAAAPVDTDALQGHELGMVPGRMLPPSDPVGVPSDPGPEELPAPSDPGTDPTAPTEIPDVTPPAEIPVGNPTELPQEVPETPTRTPDPEPAPEVTPEPVIPETPPETPPEPEPEETPPEPPEETPDQPSRPDSTSAPGKKGAKKKKKKADKGGSSKGKKKKKKKG